MEELPPVLQNLVMTNLSIVDKLRARLVCRTWKTMFEKNLRVHQTRLRITVVVKGFGCQDPWRERELNGPDKVAVCSAHPEHRIYSTDHVTIYANRIVQEFDPETHFENDLINPLHVGRRNYHCLKTLSMVCPNVTVLVLNMQQSHWKDWLSYRDICPDEFVFTHFKKLVCLVAPNMTCGISSRFWFSCKGITFPFMRHLSVQSLTFDLIYSRRKLFPNLTTLDAYEFNTKFPHGSLQHHMTQHIIESKSIFRTPSLIRISCPLTPSLTMLRSDQLPRLESVAETTCASTLQSLGPVYLSRKTMSDFGVKVPTFKSLRTLKVVMRSGFPALKLRRILETNDTLTSLSLYFSGETCSLDELRVLLSGHVCSNVENLEYSCLTSCSETLEFLGHSFPNLKHFCLIYLSTSTFSLGLYRVTNMEPVIKRQYFPRLESLKIHFVKSFPKVHFIKPFVVPLILELMSEESSSEVKTLSITSDGSAFFHFPRRSSKKIRSLEGVTLLVKDPALSSWHPFIPLLRKASNVSELHVIRKE